MSDDQLGHVNVEVTFDGDERYGELLATLDEVADHVNKARELLEGLASVELSPRLITRCDASDGA